MTDNPANKPDRRVHAETTDDVVVRYDRDEGTQRIRTLIHSTVGSVPTQPEEEALDRLIEQLRLANIDANNALAAADRAEKYAEERDQVAQRFEEQWELARAGTSGLETALEQSLDREDSLRNACERALALLETERFLEDVEAKPVRAVLRGALGDDR